ncbi:MAG: sodium:proton antiporter, partial [Planctomycetia bacterium]
MHDSTSSQPTAAASPLPSAASSRTVAGIAILLAAYAAAALFGWPQHGRDLLVAAQAAHGETGPDAGHAAGAGAGGHDVGGTAPPPVTVLPFAVLLGAIAILPLTSRYAHWWEHNSSKLLVAGGLALVTLAYYALMHRQAVDLHFPVHGVVAPAGAGPSWGVAGAILTNALLAEYVPFIVLLFALYCITGGVRIEGDLEATPTVNATFLGLGALAASFIGTTGAAMLLVRPLLETNRERRIVAHTVVFFIFMVCNCGGCLLPIGDPPLFLGYLEGVDFLWTFSLWKPWLVTNAALLAIYWLWDTFHAHPREREGDIQRDIRLAGRLKVSGIWPNALLMAGVIAAVALLDPAKAMPGTNWHPWMFLREAVL